VDQNLAVNVYVEPDDIGPWVGLAGVVVGIGLTKGIDAVSGRRRGRKERKNEVLAASSELMVAVDALLYYGTVVKGLSDQITSQPQRRCWPWSRVPQSTEPLLDWAKAIHEAQRSVIEKSDRVSYLSPGELGIAAMRVATEALGAMYGDPEKTAALKEAQQWFRELRVEQLEQQLRVTAWQVRHTGAMIL
jgi:hypothetical protein